VPHLRPGGHGDRAGNPFWPNRTVTAEQLFADLFPQPNTLPVPGGIHWSLFLEALLLDECNAATIAGLASRQHEKELSDTVRALQNPGSTAAQQKPATAPNSLIGRLPDQSFPIKWDGNPWIPLFLVWEVSWQSAYASPAASDDALPQDLLSSRWNLVDNAGGDLMLKDEGPYPAGSAGEASYQGYAILTPSTANNLVQRLEALDKSHPLVNILKNQRVLAQSLDGFNDALLLQQPGIQLPPLDFDKWLDSAVNRVNLRPWMPPSMTASMSGATPSVLRRASLADRSSRSAPGVWEITRLSDRRRFRPDAETAGRSDQSIGGGRLGGSDAAPRELVRGRLDCGCA
jgi:hypothetical protein